MIKIGWGTKVAVLYIGFVLLIGGMIAMCLNQKIDLVCEDYYQKELLFQDKIDEIKNANALEESISHTITDTNMELIFPTIFKGENVAGKILFFRPSDASKDFTTPIHLDEREQQNIALTNLSKGMYKMQISWNANDIAYFDEKVIVIP